MKYIDKNLPDNQPRRFSIFFVFESTSRRPCRHPYCLDGQILKRTQDNYLLHKLVAKPVYRDYKIEYLAEECRFASQQVFTIAFKKETGVTPSYFIENLKKDEAEKGYRE